jgi:hypothetical protein
MADPLSIDFTAHNEPLMNRAEPIANASLHRRARLEFSLAVAKLRVIDRSVLVERLPFVEATGEHLGLIGRRIAVLFR